MPILDLMRSRRSVRSYKPDPLTEEQIKQIIEAGCLAPSAHNYQPWRFIVITDRDTINRLSFSAQGYLKSRTEGSDALSYFGSQERLDRVKERLEFKEDTVFYGAPCLVLVVAEKGNEYAEMDIGMACQNMCLYAREQGIGSCVVGYARHCDRDEILSVGMKDNQELIFGITFGYSDDMDGKGVNRDFDKIQSRI